MKGQNYLGQKVSAKTYIAHTDVDDGKGGTYYTEGDILYYIEVINTAKSIPNQYNKSLYNKSTGKFIPYKADIEKGYILLQSNPNNQLFINNYIAVEQLLSIDETTSIYDIDDEINKIDMIDSNTGTISLTVWYNKTKGVLMDITLPDAPYDDFEPQSMQKALDEANNRKFLHNIHYVNHNANDMDALFVVIDNFRAANLGSFAIVSSICPVYDPVKTKWYAIVAYSSAV